MKTYRITIEYTTRDTAPHSSPDWWDWPELLDPTLGSATFGVWVEEAPLNADHVARIESEVTA